MHTFWFSILLTVFSGLAFAQPSMIITNFNVADVPRAEPDCSQPVFGPQLVDDVDRIVSDRRYWAADKDTIYILPEGAEPPVSTPEMLPLGLSAQQALLASRDSQDSNGCSSQHLHGDLANRWCHSALARVFSSVLERIGVSPGLASLAGGVFWVPKEFFVDRNPSPSDLVITYADRLGTKSTTFEVTLYGDAFKKERSGYNGVPFSRSGPFLTIRRKF
jgi:hypothetical protein